MLNLLLESADLEKLLLGETIICSALRLRISVDKAVLEPLQDQESLTSLIALLGYQ